MDTGLDIQQVLLWASGMSLLAALLALAAVPWVVTRLPANYFTRPQRTTWREINGEPLFVIVLGLFKNLVGALLLLLGLVMLVTPGQGVLTMLVGLLLMNFPGKYQLERWLVLRPGVLRALNWLRNRQGQPPFEGPES